MSVHATGRALDLHIPLHEGDADNDLGDPVGNWLIEHAEEIGIQYIIWDRWTWGAHRRAGEKERAYGGAHPHDDHLHIELSTVAAELGTPWFAGPMEPPEETGCEPLPADGGVIDETDACFRAYGPATYWRREGSAGHDGSLLWTNAYEGDARATGPDGTSRHPRPASTRFRSMWIRPSACMPGRATSSATQASRARRSWTRARPKVG